MEKATPAAYFNEEDKKEAVKKLDDFVSKLASGVQNRLLTTVQKEVAQIQEQADPTGKIFDGKTTAKLKALMSIKQTLKGK